MLNGHASTAAFTFYNIYIESKLLHRNLIKLPSYLLHFDIIRVAVIIIFFKFFVVIYF